MWGNFVDKETALVIIVVSLAEMGGSNSLCVSGKVIGLFSFILIYDLAVFFMILLSIKKYYTTKIINHVRFLSIINNFFLVNA